MPRKYFQLLFTGEVLILVVVAAFCGCTIECKAQQRSIREEILAHTQPNNELIYRGRKMILDRIVAGDRDKVKEVMLYLIDSTEDKDHIAFHPVEKWLLYFWSGQYTQVLEDSRRFESFLSHGEGRNVPIYDALLRDVRAKVTYERLLIQGDINRSEFSSIEKAFLILNLDYLVTEDQESTNQACNGFLMLYPNSEFESYIRKYLRYQYKLSKFGYGLEIFSGYGILTQELTNSFSNSVPIGFDFDLGYNRLMLYLRGYFGLGSTKDSIQFSQATWKKDEKAQTFLTEASLGYSIYSNSSIRVTPFVGIGGMSIKPPDRDKEDIPGYKHVGLDMTTTFTMGLNIDLFVGKSSMEITYPGDADFFIRIRYAYNQPQFDKTYTGFSGNFHYLTIGFGMFGRGTKRVD